MKKKKKIMMPEELPEFETSLEHITVESRLFVDKSLEIADYILQVMAEKKLKQKDLAEAMGKSEAEISKWLGGMHNYTLRSLAKIEAALDCNIICTPMHVKVNFQYKEAGKRFGCQEKTPPEITAKIQYAKVIKLTFNEKIPFETLAI